jgi:hypothetical protein
MKSNFGRVCAFLATSAFVALLSTPTFAHDKKKEPPVTLSAPEIGPGFVGATAALLVGGALLISSRRARASR